MTDEKIVEILEQLYEAAKTFKKYHDHYAEKPDQDVRIYMGDNAFYLSDEVLEAIKEAIKSINEDKITFLQCVDGRLFVVDSKKSLDDLTSESCEKCKRIDELAEIRMENNHFLNSLMQIDVEKITRGSCKDCTQSFVYQEPFNNHTIFSCKKGIKPANRICLEECLYFEQKELEDE